MTLAGTLQNLLYMMLSLLLLQEVEEEDEAENVDMSDLDVDSEESLDREEL